MKGKEIVGTAAVAVLVLATGTAVAARQDASTITDTVSTLDDNEAGESRDSDGSLAGSSARRAAAP